MFLYCEIMKKDNCINDKMIRLPIELREGSCSVNTTISQIEHHVVYLFALLYCSCSCSLLMGTSSFWDIKSHDTDMLHYHIARLTTVHLVIITVNSP